MRKRLRILLVVALVAAVGGLAWLVFFNSPRDPVYHGKPLREWLVKYTESINDGAQSEAEVAIRAIGTNGLPLLLKWVGAKDSPVKEKAVTLIRKQSLFKVSWNTDAESRLLARMAFEVLGPDAAPAVPSLIELLNGNFNADVQGEVVISLGRIGPAAEDAVPALIKCLESTNYFAALFIPNSLAMIHRKPELSIPALIQHLESSKRRPMHLWRTVKALGDFGSDAEAAFPRLVPFLDDQYDQTRSSATNALKAIDPEAAAKAGVQ